MILVTGASGLLGASVVVAAASRGASVVAQFHTHRVDFPGVTGHALDLRNESSVDFLFDEYSPEWIINCAALTDVDWCETNPIETQRVNCDIPTSLAKHAAHRSARLIHISTDAVFDGVKGCYGENDETGPVNAYGRSKLQAEGVVTAASDDNVVVRTSIYGWNVQPKQSLAEWILATLAAGDVVRGFYDVVFSPMFVDDLADIILEMTSRKMNGVFHAASKDHCTKFEFATRLAEAFGYDTTQIRRASIADSALVAPRGRDLSLRTDKLARSLGHELADVRSGIERFRARQGAGVAREPMSYGEEL